MQLLGKLQLKPWGMFGKLRTALTGSRKARPPVANEPALPIGSQPSAAALPSLCVQRGNYTCKRLSSTRSDDYHFVRAACKQDENHGQVGRRCRSGTPPWAQSSRTEVEAAILKLPKYHGTQAFKPSLLTVLDSRTRQEHRRPGVGKGAEPRLVGKVRMACSLPALACRHPDHRRTCNQQFVER